MIRRRRDARLADASRLSPRPRGLARRGLGLTRRFAQCFTDRRDPRYVEHSVETLVGQRVFGLALGYGAAIALGSLAITSSANATVRHFGQGRYYGAVPATPRFYESPVMPGFRESPTYAPDRSAPRGYNNPGIPDFQDGSRI